MTKRQIAKFEVCRRSGDFGSKHQQYFPPGSAGAQAFAEIAGVLNGLSTSHQATLALARRRLNHAPKVLIHGPRPAQARVPHVDVEAHARIVSSAWAVTSSQN